MRIAYDIIDEDTKAIDINVINSHPRQRRERNSRRRLVVDVKLAERYRRIRTA